MKTLNRCLINFYDVIETVCMKIIDIAYEHRTKARERWIKCGGLDTVRGK